MGKHTALLMTLAAYPLAVYAVLFLGMIIEGDLLIFTAGFLVRLGTLHLWPTFWSIFIGTLVGDSAWFYLGRLDTTRNKILHWLGRMTDVAGQKVDHHVKDRTIRTLFITKFVYGTHHFTLVRAGRLGVPYLKFLKADAIGSFFWVVIVGSIGVLASASLELIRHRLRYLELALLLGIVLYFLLSGLISKLLKKEL